jgi:hypothetical protein
MNIATAYQFTVDDMDDQRITDLKQMVKMMNKVDGYETRWERDDAGRLVKKTNRTHYWRLKYRGRGSRWTPEKIQAKRDAFRQQYDRNISEGYAKHSLAQDLPVWMAERIAVYLYKERVYK